MKAITLTTDFGTQDWFVGTMKGVILGIAPRAAVVDITHEIAQGDVRGGAFALATSYRFFPKGTIHVAVVDPGVGSRRGTIVVQTANCFFVGPDNGVLSFALAQEKIKSIRRLENEKYFLKPVSRTFHGRDVFAPVAAHLSRSVPIQKFGSATRAIVRLDWPRLKTNCGAVECEVIYVDRFGNAITNMDAKVLGLLGKGAGVFQGKKRLCAVGEFYQSVPSGWAVAVLGSSGFLEIAINGGSAAQALSLRVGTRLSLRPGKSALKYR